MNEFIYRGDDLYCEKVLVRGVASEVGTPFYLYSQKTLENHFTVFDSAFSAVPHLTCYSVKANSNLSLIKLFSDLGGGLDVVSGGEIFRALRAGVSPAKIVYSGVGKTRAEIEYALDFGILMFNVESPQELDLIDSVAADMGKKARIALRVNPDVDPKTHPYISTGLKENKFGIRIESAMDEYKRAVAMKNIDVAGVDCHIGSQLTETGPFADTIAKVKDFVSALINEGMDIRYLDIGGGLGITYDKETPPSPAEYADVVIKGIGDLPCTLILEPGRVIVGNAGVLVTRVLYTKKTEDKNFIIVDAGMNDLVRPSLYGAYQGILPLKKNKGDRITADIVGPICETGDFLAKSREIQNFEKDEFLAVESAGAYGFTMASNYNSRPKIAEILVNGAEYFTVRNRETYEDLVKHENVPEHIKKSDE